MCSYMYKGILPSTQRVKSSQWNKHVRRNGAKNELRLRSRLDKLWVGMRFYTSVAGVNEREEFKQETQHTQQTATRKAQNQDKKIA